VYAAVRGDTDSEHLFALIAEAWLESTQTDEESRLLEATCDGVRRMMAFCEQGGTRALLTALVSDGVRVAAVRAAHQGQPPTLYFCQGQQAVRFASEPLDNEAGWKVVAPGTCLLGSGPGLGLREAEI
jgi:glutamine amidotransferase